MGDVYAQLPRGVKLIFDMCSMQKTHDLQAPELMAIDLNLLTVFDALMDEVSVTAAAQRLRASQPTVSRALAKLRLIFDDPLLVRTRYGMAPTARAVELAPQVRAITHAARRVFAPPRPFVAAGESRVYRVMTADYAQAVLVPALIDHLQRAAPGVMLGIEAWSMRGMLDALESGKTDIVIGPRLSRAPGLQRRTLFEDQLVTIVRRDHPTVGDRLSAVEYARCQHVQVAPDGRAGGVVDDALYDAGLSRTVALRVSSFVAAPVVVAATNLIATVPARVADLFEKPLGLRRVRTELRFDGFVLEALWHVRSTTDPGITWLRKQLLTVARGLPTQGVAVRVRRLNLRSRTAGSL